MTNFSNEMGVHLDAFRSGLASTGIAIDQTATAGKAIFAQFVNDWQIDQNLALAGIAEMLNALTTASEQKGTNRMAAQTMRLMIESCRWVIGVEQKEGTLCAAFHERVPFESVTEFADSVQNGETPAHAEFVAAVKQTRNIPTNVFGSQEWLDSIAACDPAMDKPQKPKLNPHERACITYANAIDRDNNIKDGAAAAMESVLSKPLKAKTTKTATVITEIDSSLLVSAGVEVEQQQTA